MQSTRTAATESGPGLLVAAEMGTDPRRCAVIYSTSKPSSPRRRKLLESYTGTALFVRYGSAVTYVRSLLEVESFEEAEAIVRLPISQRGMSEFQIIPLHPHGGFTS